VNGVSGGAASGGGAAGGGNATGGRAANAGNAGGAGNLAKAPSGVNISGTAGSVSAAKAISSGVARGAPPERAWVITVSDGCAAGRREDRSGLVVAEMLAAAGFALAGREVLPDERERLARRLRELAGLAELVVTTGGTGLAPRDVTPEATQDACDRLAPGLAERMRLAGAAATPLAWLSRGVCGVCGACLILNLPGSPRGAAQSLQAVIGLLPHAAALLRGQTDHT
jgi:molybdopterin adenylyltransferase